MLAPEEPQEAAAPGVGARRAPVAVRRSHRTLRLALLAGLAGLAASILSGCSGDVTTPGETLRILGTTLPPAYVAESYDQAVQAVGGLRPYDFKLADGALPPGLELQGGAIRGVPGKTGRYTFTVQVSDANLSTTVQKYTLTVTQVPPPTLDLNAPDTQVDRPVTLRAQVQHARKLEGLRTQVRWDASRFALVPGSVKVSRPGLALLQKASQGELQVAVVPLGTQLDGQTDLFEFQLKPVAGAAKLDLRAQTEYVSAGGHAFDRIGGASGAGATAGTSSGTPSSSSGNDGTSPGSAGGSSTNGASGSPTGGTP